MCGIVGVTNTKKAVSILLSGLKSLQYRGYDSVGIYTNNNVYKSLFRVEDLEKKMVNINGNSGIGHTRWATHGKVSLENAHPHTSFNKLIYLVHNGVIHNYLELKELLIKEGYSFYGETDSEVLANFIEYTYLKTNSFEETLKIINEEIKGEMAIVFMKKEDDTLYFLKRNSPLVLGKRNNFYALASDVVALSFLKEFYYLKDGEYGYLSSSVSKIFSDGNYIEIPFEKNNHKYLSPTKGHFKHFMKKEIYEEKEVIKRIKDKYFNSDDSVLKKLNKELENKNVVLLGCGTSFNAISYVVSRIGERRLKAFIASEYKYNIEDDTFIFVSQSGETYDLIKVKEKLPKGTKVILITNNINSTLSRISDISISMEAGYEVAVAATKSYLASILILLGILKYHLMNDIYFQDLYHVIKETFKQKKLIDKFSNIIKTKRSLYYVGKYEGFEIMSEGALKIKEIAYIHAEAIHAGELKHGPIATLSKDFAALFLKTLDEKEIEANAIEVKSRIKDTYVLGFDSKCDFIFKKGPKYFEYLGSIIFLQLLSYETANRLNVDIDKPRNLAKSVTVI